VECNSKQLSYKNVFGLQERNGGKGRIFIARNSCGKLMAKVIMKIQVILMPNPCEAWRR